MNTIDKAYNYLLPDSFFKRSEFRNPAVKNLTLLIILIILFSNCGGKKYDTINPADIDLRIIRFEKELFSMDIYDIPGESKILQKKYPDFMSLYTNKIIEVGDQSQNWYNEALTKFVTDQAIFEIYSRTEVVFPDLNGILPQLNAGFGRYKTLFPEKNIPVIYTYISGFNQTFVTAENILGISLEKFLGKDEPLYSDVYPPIPQYQKRNMQPDKIPVDILRAWITTDFEYKPEQDNLLSNMIYEGRNMYLLKHLFPDIPDTLIWGIQEKKLQYCIDNEKQMWTYLIEFKLLFNSDNFRITQLIEDAPFTKDFGKNSPGRATIWIGYKIVESYMEKHKNLTFYDLMNETNYQKILNESRYNP